MVHLSVRNLATLNHPSSRRQTGQDNKFSNIINNSSWIVTRITLSGMFNKLIEELSLFGHFSFSKCPKKDNFYDFDQGSIVQTRKSLRCTYGLFLVFFIYILGVSYNFWQFFYFRLICSFKANLNLHNFVLTRIFL